MDKEGRIWKRRNGVEQNIRKMGRFHLNIFKECLVKWKGKIVKKKKKKKRGSSSMTLGHTTNSAECARCVAFFFFFTKLSPSLRFPKDGPHDAGPKNSADTSVVPTLLNETFFFPLPTNLRHSLKFFFFYVSSNRITFITLRIFFTHPFRKKRKRNRQSYSFHSCRVVVP